MDAIGRTLADNKTYADKFKVKTRCVTVDYAGDFHLDVIPRVAIDGKHYVCNRRANKFEETDGKRIPGVVQREEQDHRRQPEAGGEAAQVPP